MRTDPTTPNADVELTWQTGADHGKIELTDVNPWALMSIKELITEHGNVQAMPDQVMQVTLTHADWERLKFLVMSGQNSLYDSVTQIAQSFGSNSEARKAAEAEAAKYGDAVTRVYNALPIGDDIWELYRLSHAEKED